MTREWDRAYAEASGDWSEYVKKWRGDMTDRQEPAAWLVRPYEATTWAVTLEAPTEDTRRSMEFVPLYRTAGKVSPAQLKAAVDAMGGCDLPYLPRARREIFARATAKAWGLEIA